VPPLNRFNRRFFLSWQRDLGWGRVAFQFDALPSSHRSGPDALGLSAKSRAAVRPKADLLGRRNGSEAVKGLQALTRHSGPKQMGEPGHHPRFKQGRKVVLRVHPCLCQPFPISSPAVLFVKPLLATIHAFAVPRVRARVCAPSRACDGGRNRLKPGRFETGLLNQVDTPCIGQPRARAHAPSVLALFLFVTTGATQTRPGLSDRGEGPMAKAPECPSMGHSDRPNPQRLEYPGIF
jgi:hypothetical protein